MRDPQRIRSDYKEPLHRIMPGLPNRHWRLRWLVLGASLVVIGAVMGKSQEPSPDPAPAAQVSDATEFVQVSLELPAPAPLEANGLLPAENDPADPALEWQMVTVQRGDSLARLLARAGVSSQTVHQLASAGDKGAQLARIYPGDRIALGHDTDGQLVQLVREMDVDRRLVFERNGAGFDGSMVEDELETRQIIAQGQIQSSLFLAGMDAGLSNRMIMEMARIFGWDIDFAMDLRQGDEFRLIYEAYYRDGERVRDGNIIAAEFTNQGHTFRALRYTNPEGEADYFAPDGTSMRRAFLRAPLEYSRITSGFGPRRHPVLHTMRNHNGVDYAAPPGTPIRATGDGRIVHRGRHGGYGHTVIIQHGETYRTLYAHLSRYRDGQRLGGRVRQGEVIGYVGSSGLATGPHLHYEFLENGRHRDPQRVELPSGDPVPADYREHFQSKAAPLIAQLDTLQRFYAQRGD